MSAFRGGLLAGCLALALGGCKAIHSEAVRDLVKLQGEKIGEAKGNSARFVEQTRDRVQLYRRGVADLNAAMTLTNVRETEYALVMGANQNVQSKTQLDALAFLYQAGVLYLDTQSGLQEAVLHQFEADFAAMDALSRQIARSWDDLAALNGELDAHAARTSAVAADPAILRTLVGMSGAEPLLMDAAVSKALRFNEALKKAAHHVPGDVLEQPAGYVDEFVDLLERVRGK